MRVRWNNVAVRVVVSDRNDGCCGVIHYFNLHVTYHGPLSYKTGPTTKVGLRKRPYYCTVINLWTASLASRSGSHIVQNPSLATAPGRSSASASQTRVRVLGAVSFCHLLNDGMQALLPALYPILSGNFKLSFIQIGVLTLVYQLTASILQPFIGAFTDRRPQPYSLPFAMLSSLMGLLMLTYAQSYPSLVAGAAMLGLGSSIFHPESSRIARLAAGRSHGLAQSIFQVGGNTGSALGPLVAAFFILPRGIHGLVWILPFAFFGALVMAGLGYWQKHIGSTLVKVKKVVATGSNGLTSKQVKRALGVLFLLLFSKYVYLASITNFYTFFLMHRFGLPTRDAQLCQFAFFAAVATGTVLGAPIGDRIGSKKVIWLSILGVLPFTLVLPYVSLPLTICLSIIIGLVLSSAFPAVIVFAQELVPGKTGTISGLFFGFIFGVGGIAAAGLGSLADQWGIESVYRICAFLPLIGLAAALLPNLQSERP